MYIEQQPMKTQNTGKSQEEEVSTVKTVTLKQLHQESGSDLDHITTGNIILPEQQVIAFGSRVTNTAKVFSDLDLCIMNNQPLPLNILTDLREAFSESELPFRVDIVELATISVEFKEIVIKNSIIIK